MIQTNDKKNQKKNNIIEAAISFLNKMDYKEIRVEDIAKQAGMSKSTFFYYFPSKGALYLDIHDMFYKQMLDKFTEKLRFHEQLDYQGFEEFMMETSHIAIHDFFILIKLMVDVDQIFFDCTYERVLESSRFINNTRAAYNRELIGKTKVFHDMELSYILSSQLLILETCYRQSVRVYKYKTKEAKFLFYEMLSIYEYRSVRMLKYFIGGMIYEKQVLKNEAKAPQLPENDSSIAHASDEAK